LQNLTANAYENNIAVVVTCFHISLISGGVWPKLGGQTTNFSRLATARHDPSATKL